MKIKTPVLTITARKGGVGKTFGAINAAVLAACGGPDKKLKPLRVLLIDVDSQQNTTGYFLKYLGTLMMGRKAILPANPDCDRGDVYNITDIFMGNEFIEYPTQYENLSIIPSDGDIDDFTKEFDNNPEEDIVKFTAMQFEALINAVSEDYDLVVIDTPPSKTHASQGAIAASTHVLVMAELDIFNTEDALPGIMSDIDYVNTHLRNKDNPVSIVGILPNKISSTKMTLDERKCLNNIQEMFPQHIHPSFHFYNRTAFRTTVMPEDPKAFKYMKDQNTANQMRGFYDHLCKTVLADAY